VATLARKSQLLKLQHDYQHLQKKLCGQIGFVYHILHYIIW